MLYYYPRGSNVIMQLSNCPIPRFYFPKVFVIFNIFSYESYKSTTELPCSLNGDATATSTQARSSPVCPLLVNKGTTHLKQCYTLGYLRFSSDRWL